MPTPQIYYSLHEEHEALRALAFKLLMSDEVASLGGPNASALFDLVGDFTDQGASEATRNLESDRMQGEVFDPTDPTSRMYEDEIVE